MSNSKPRIRCVENADPSIILIIFHKVKYNQKIYLNGVCWGLFEYLHQYFKNSVAWYDPIEGHVYTKINQIFYDAKGSYLNPPVQLKLGGIYRKHISQMRRNANRELENDQNHLPNC